MQKVVLQQYQAVTATKRRCAGFLQRLSCLAGFCTIKTTEVDAAPAGIDDLFDQTMKGSVSRCRVITPEQMNGHGSTISDIQRFSFKFWKFRSAFGIDVIPTIRFGMISKLEICFGRSD